MGAAAKWQAVSQFENGRRRPVVPAATEPASWRQNRTEILPNDKRACLPGGCPDELAGLNPVRDTAVAYSEDNRLGDL